MSNRIQPQKRNSSRRNDRRRYTMTDMACIKLDAAITNSRVRRGVENRTNNQYIVECGCGMEGCFIHSSFKGTNAH